jgi:TonB-linked SusC/RagA family outer membrane protein
MFDRPPGTRNRPADQAGRRKVRVADIKNQSGKTAFFSSPKLHESMQLIAYCGRAPLRAASTKTLRIMKLTAILLLFGGLSVSAATRAQQITLSEKDASLEKVFKEVERQSGYVFFFDNTWLDKARPVTLQVRDMPLSSALDLCFRDQPLTYSIVGRNIVVRLRENERDMLPANAADTLVVISGRVVDSAYMPLQGASILVSGKDKGGTQTDANGNFSFRTNSAHPVLVVSYLGFATREVRWPEGIKTITIRLHPSSDPLDAVQVIAYGTNTRRFSVGSISTVTSEDIEKQPVNNVLLALEGLVPGLAVTPSSGAPGASVQLQIRGQNTLQGASPLPTGALPPATYDQPLFIVDGVPMAAQNNNLNQLTSILSGQTSTTAGLSPFNGISPQDIESISVLKDADATSIYGSQGANGVILITTKKGKPGKTQFNVSVNSGPNKITRHTQMMNTPEYLALRHEAIQNDGTSAPTDPGSYPDLSIFDTTRSHNWFNDFFGGTANTTDLHAQLSGGNNTTTFLLSVGYSHQVFNTPGGFSQDGLFYHSSFHYNSQDHRLNIDVTGDVSYTTNDNSGSPGVTSAFLLPPDLPALLDPKGNLVWNYKGSDISEYQQYAFIKQKYQAGSYLFNNSLTVGYKLLPGLNIRAVLGYNDSRTAETSINPLSAQNPNTGYAQNSAIFTNGAFQTIDAEPQVDYNLTAGKGRLSAIVGGEYKSATNSTNYLEGINYPTDALLTSIAGASYVYGSTGSTIYKYAAGFGRIQYIYNQKYILSLTGRRDGSSKFGPGRQFGDFGSAGAGYIFSEEPSFKKTLPFISYGKLAGNYGTSGGDGVQPYQYLSLWEPIQNTPTFEGIASYKPLNLYNPNFSWDTKRSLNISLDLGFLHDRLLINAAWYLSRCGNQLTGAALPAQTGFGQVLENFPANVQNTGLEFAITSKNITSKNFSWSTSLIISGNRNKLISFPDLNTSPYASTYTIGKPVTELHGYKFAGLNDTTGLYQFYNAAGKIPSDPGALVGTPSTQGGDIVPIGDLTPDYSGSLANTITYKGFSLSFNFQFSKGKGYNYLNSLYANSAFPGEEFNMPEIVQNRWRKPGDHAPIQRASAGYSEASFTASYFARSDGGIGDASYIRLKNVALSYSLPSGFLRRIGVKGLNLYLRGENLLTFTGYKVGDPEMQSLFNFPLQRIVLGGLSINL